MGEVDNTSPSGQSPGNSKAEGSSGPPGRRGITPKQQTGGADSVYGALENDLTNQQIGRYLIQRRLGSGGTAVVYQAYDQVLGRSVALKILASTADEKTLIRFRREAMTSGALHHPNIVRTLQVGVAPHGDVAYIAMELVEGESLSALLDRCGYLDPDEAAALLTPIAAALSHAHENEIIHRDVKPSNILLQPSRAGNKNSVHIDVLEYPVIPMLSDFGIARSLDAPELTNQGRTVGTPAFMAPEQCAGQRDIDGRADVYSLGAVLYRCVVGRQPFLGATPQILHAHVYEPLTIDDDILRRLPPLVVEILALSMAKQATDRYSSAYDMAAALSEAGGYVIDIDPGQATSTPTATVTLDNLQPADTGTSSSASILVPGLSRSIDGQTPVQVPATPYANKQAQTPTILPQYDVDRTGRTYIPNETGRASTRRWGSLALLFVGVFVGALTALFISGAFNRILPTIFTESETINTPAPLDNAGSAGDAGGAGTVGATSTPFSGGEESDTFVVVPQTPDDDTTSQDSTLENSSTGNSSPENSSTGNSSLVNTATAEGQPAPTKTPVANAVSPTILITLVPSDTPVFTQTPTPTNTSIASSTPTFTATSTDTPTATPTETGTPAVPPSPTWTPPSTSTEGNSTLPPTATPTSDGTLDETPDGTPTPTSPPTATLLPPTPTWTPASN